MITLHNNIWDKCLWQSGLFTWWRDCECWQGLVWYSGMDTDVLWVWMQPSSRRESVSLNPCSLRELFLVQLGELCFWLCLSLSCCLEMSRTGRMTLCPPLSQRADGWVCSWFDQTILVCFMTFKIFNCQNKLPNGFPSIWATCLEQVGKFFVLVLVHQTEDLNKDQK